MRARVLVEGQVDTPPSSSRWSTFVLIEKYIRIAPAKIAWLISVGSDVGEWASPRSLSRLGLVQARGGLRGTEQARKFWSQGYPPAMGQLNARPRAAPLGCQRTSKPSVPARLTRLD